MKKNKINKEIPFFAKGKENAVVVAAKQATIEDEKHIIIDVTVDKKPFYRFIFCGVDSSLYVPEDSALIGAEKKWYYNSVIVTKAGWCNQKFHIIDDTRLVSRNLKVSFTKGTKAVLREYKADCRLKTYDDVSRVLDAMSQEKENEKQKKANDELDKQIALLDEKPSKGFEKYALSKVETHKAYLMPFKGAKTSSAFFTCCQKEVKINKGEMKPKDIVKCPYCKNDAIVVSDRGHGYYFSNEKTVAMLDNLKDGSGFAIRFFSANFRILDDRTTKSWVTEQCRVYCQSGIFKTYFQYYSNFNSCDFWSDTCLVNPQFGGFSAWKEAYVYPKSMKNVNGYDASDCFTEGDIEYSVLTIMKQFNPTPLGILYKAGIRGLKESKYANSKGKTPEEILGISSKGVKILTVYSSQRVVDWITFAEKNSYDYDSKLIYYVSDKKGVKAGVNTFAGQFDLSEEAFNFAFLNNFDARKISWLRTIEKEGLDFAFLNSIPEGIVRPEKVKNSIATMGLKNYVNFINNEAKECVNGKYKLDTFMLALEEKPLLEFVVKTGLYNLALDIIEDTFKYRKNMEFLEGEAGIKALGISKEEYNRFKQANGNYVSLLWYRYENKSQKRIADNVIAKFAKCDIKPDGAYLNYTTPQKAWNYLWKIGCRRNSLNYTDKPKNKIKELSATWNDFTLMAERAKYNLSKSLLLMPKKLKAAHDELANSEKIALRKEEVLSKFPDINEIFKEIKDKYEYHGKEYSVIVPTSVEDIIFEGAALGHCLDRTDLYFQRIQNRESYIMFLRRTDEIHTPWYTLEVEPGLTIRQKRTTGDTQDKSYNEAVMFLKDWQKIAKKNLTKSDYELAKISAIERNKNFAQLFKNKATVKNGIFKGRSLVELLQKDLMIA